MEQNCENKLQIHSMTTFVKVTTLVVFVMNIDLLAFHPIHAEVATFLPCFSKSKQYWLRYNQLMDLIGPG